MQQTGQYSGSFYSSGAPSVPDPAHPYNNSSNNPPQYGSAPPYTSYPSFYTAPDPSYNTPAGPTYAPQAPPYTSPQSLADNLGALTIGSQLPYIATQNSYAPTVPSYDQSFSAQVGPGPNPGMAHPSASSELPNYSPTGQSFASAAYGPGPSQTGYSGGSSVVEAYGMNHQGFQSYDSNLGLSVGKTGVPDQGGGSYTQGRSYDRPGFSQTPSFEPSYYEKPTARAGDKGNYEFDEGGYSEVFAYDGGNLEPYGARGSGSGSSWGAFESFNSSSGNLNSFADSGSAKLSKAIPKVETEDKGSGVQKYRLKLLPDSGSASGPMDVLCQIGLDGVRMISPTTNKTVRIYPLETITRWEVNEPAVFTFWAKSAVDVESRRIRLQSSSYTTNAILDTLTAACVQLSEMVGKDGSADTKKTSGDTGKNLDQTSEKKKASLVEWMTLKNRQNAPEERQHWVPDEAVTKCSGCANDFGAFLRRHHCRNCGDIFCDKCTNGRIALTADEDAPPVRVCDRCLAEVTQRLSNAKDLSNKPPAPRSHEDLAKKLQEEMERNAPRRLTASSTNNGSGKDRSGQTTVLNCSACGSISLVNGSSTRCPSCGIDSSSSRGSGRESSSTLKGLSQRWSSQSNSEASGKHTQEVACPTCTVHLQVQVPSYGTETVECGVCQHPFLVSAH